MVARLTWQRQRDWRIVSGSSRRILAHHAGQAWRPVEGIPCVQRRDARRVRRIGQLRSWSMPMTSRKVRALTGEVKRKKVVGRGGFSEVGLGLNLLTSHPGGSGRCWKNNTFSFVLKAWKDNTPKLVRAIQLNTR